MVQVEMDKDAIIATVMDYFEGWFDGDALRMERALHPDLVKRGVRTIAGNGQISGPSTTAQMINWTREGEGKAERPADLAIKIQVDDIYEHIATATVYSAVYTEYVQLVRMANGWRIVSALYMRRNKEL